MVVDSLEAARERIVELEQENLEMGFAVAQYRMVLEHYLNICVTVGADPKPAAEALTKLPLPRARRRIWRVK